MSWAEALVACVSIVAGTRLIWPVFNPAPPSNEITITPELLESAIVHIERQIREQTTLEVRQAMEAGAFKGSVYFRAHITLTAEKV